MEIDVDPKLYAAGHIPGAVGWDWTTQLNDQVRRDIISKEDFEKLNSEAGIKNTDTIIIYGDSSNWFAAFGFWLYKVYGHKDIRLLNGGRAKWLNEEGAPLTTEVPKFERSQYKVSSVDGSLRAKVSEVLAASEKKAPLVDVRSPDEFTGKIIAPPGMSETAQRGGHVPGATSIPWATAVTNENTFKSADELRAIYLDQKRLDPSKADHRLLPHRRAEQPHLVRPQVPARLQGREELRRQLDRVRQPHRRADREGRLRGPSRDGPRASRCDAAPGRTALAGSTAARTANHARRSGPVAPEAQRRDRAVGCGPLRSQLRASWRRACGRMKPYTPLSWLKSAD